jgi:hypothetical protein
MFKENDNLRGWNRWYTDMYKCLERIGQLEKSVQTGEVGMLAAAATANAGSDPLPVLKFAGEEMEKIKTGTQPEKIEPC